jgi:hypothetical protein
MLVMGEIKCLHCGFISGRWTGQGGAPLTFSGFTPAGSPGAAAAEDASALVHCARCQGSVYLEDAEPVISSTRLRRIRRMRQQIEAIETHRSRAA